MANALARWFHHLRQRLTGAPKKPAAQRPPDPRVDGSPWLTQLLDELGARYRLGEDRPEGAQIVRRTGKERFNPMRVWVRASDMHVAGDYDVRVRGGKPLEHGRELLDRKISGPLGALGLKPASESVEEWGGHVLTRRYEGACADAHAAAAAVRFICEQSDQVIDSEAE